MLSSISSYFWPAQVKPNFLDPEVDLAQKDSDGFSPIDYAVFESQAHKLPQLFKQGDASSSQIRPQHCTNLEKIINQKAIQNFEKTIAKIDDTDLDDPNSSNSILLDDFLNSDFKAHSTLKYSDIAPIHLLSLFAKPSVLEHVIAKHPDWLEIKDSRGNTPLHYAAFNKDQHHFVLLAKKGGDVFASNKDKVTALGEFVAQIQTKDPLGWYNNVIDLFFFIINSNLLPEIFNMTNVDKPFFREKLLKQLSFQIRILVSIGHASMLVSSPKQALKNFLMTLALLAINKIPYISVAYQACLTYTLAKKAWSVLKQGSSSFKSRPITALAMSIITGTNAFNSALGFYYHCDSTLKATQSLYKISQKWDDFTESVKETCGEEAFHSLQQEPYSLAEDLYYNKFSANKYPSYGSDSYGRLKYNLERDVQCALSQFEDTYVNLMDVSSKDYNPYFHDVYQGTIKPTLHDYSTTFLKSSFRDKCRFETGFRLIMHFVATIFNMKIALNKPYIFEDTEDFEWLHKFEESFKDFNNFNDSPISDELKCQNLYSRPANFKKLGELDRIRAVPHPEASGCLNMALDILGLSNLCDTTRGGTGLYNQLYRSLIRRTHPDQNPGLKDANALSQKLNVAKVIIEDAYDKKCK